VGGSRRFTVTFEVTFYEGERLYELFEKAWKKCALYGMHFSDAFREVLEELLYKLEEQEMEIARLQAELATKCECKEGQEASGEAWVENEEKAEKLK